METQDTSAWQFQAWGSFLVAVSGSVLGICYLPCELWCKGFIALAYFFTLASSFTLAKTLRDNHEQQRMVNRLKNARTEQILREFEAPPV